MSENEKKDETILDIIDIMQDFDCNGGWCDSMEDLAGRLREAWKRHLKKEQEDRLSLQHTIAELTKSIADAGETIEAQKAKLVELFSRTGDAAKMRDALELASSALQELIDCKMWEGRKVLKVCSRTECSERAYCSVLVHCRAALAAPPRNCDRFADSWEALKAWHGGLETAHSIARMLDWLLSSSTDDGSEAEGGEE